MNELSTKELEAITKDLKACFFGGVAIRGFAIHIDYPENQTLSASVSIESASIENIKLIDTNGGFWINPEISFNEAMRLIGAYRKLLELKYKDADEAYALVANGVIANARQAIANLEVQG